MSPICSFCNEPIREQSDYRQVTGWERIQRAAGGTNAIRLPDRSAQRYACQWCIEKQAHGIAYAQQSLGLH